MSDTNPNSLQTPKVSVAKMAKWPLYAAIVAVVCLVSVLLYSVHSSQVQQREEANKKIRITEEESPLTSLEGHGLSLAPPPNSPAIVVPVTPKKEERRDDSPLIVVRDNTPPVNPYQQEYENLRRSRMQSHVGALSSPLVAKRVAEASRQTVRTDAPATDTTLPSTYGFDPAMLRDNAYDPASDKDKEAFLATRATTDNDWILPQVRTAGQPLEVKTGSVIPGVMVTGINSDLPGQMIAQVSQNVFDTATGRQLLVPQGAKLYGVYDSRVIYGQERVLVAWNRVIFPDGSAITLNAMPGTDMAGYSGYSDQVDNHYFRIFGNAILMSLITGGSVYAMDTLNSDGSTDSSNSPSMQDALGASLASQLGQTTVQLLEKNLNIKPTLEIRAGYQFNIVVTKDIVFQEPYTAWR